MSGVIQIWTMQLARWRAARQHGIEVLDITAKSGDKAFAPDFARVMEYKRGELNQEQYTNLYYERMKLSREKAPHRWEKLKRHPRVALTCYCKAGVFCHRHLFATLMEDYLKAEGFEVEQMGELTT